MHLLAPLQPPTLGLAADLNLGMLTLHPALAGGKDGGTDQSAGSAVLHRAPSTTLCPCWGGSLVLGGAHIKLELGGGSKLSL